MKAIKDFEIKEKYYKPIAEKIFKLFDENLYKPMAEIFKIKASNEINVIIQALKDGRIFYEKGKFKALTRFTNAQATELEKWGAVYDRWEKAYKIPFEKIPNEVLVSIVDNKIQFEKQVDTLRVFLDAFEKNADAIIESLIFTDEVVSILDSAGNQVKENARKINVIEPELDANQKRAIGKGYTKNMAFFIKDWNKKRIVELRQKVQEAVLKGYREDYVRKIIEQEFHIGKNKAAFLAKSETNIMLAEYKKATYQKMGFNEFKWHTIMDGRERPLHKELNGKIFRYDNPPIIDERTGQRGLPGETYGCRCNMTPISRESVFVTDKEYRKGTDYSNIEKYLSKKRGIM